MKGFIKSILSTIIGLVSGFFLLIFLLVGLISVMSSDNEITIDENSILKIDLGKISVVERRSNNPLSTLNLTGDISETIEIKQILDNIEKAKKDNNITAIYLNTSVGVNAGLSQIEEIRNKLLEFKKTGKKIIAYSEVYSQSSYYLASVANKIYLNPEGIIELKGFSASIMFYTGLFEKLDIDVQVIRHGKFKSAVEPFTLKKMSKSNRVQLELLLNSFADNIMDSIANQRKINLSDVEKHANELALESAQTSLKLKYVDSLLYEDQVYEVLSSIAKIDEVNFISLAEYSSVNNFDQKISKNKIAIIYANGSIISGKGDEETIGSETTVKAIRQAGKDKNVKAIVLRINSPGGSALASDIILRELILAKKNKPIVVSMGDYAASGGYYIACAADRIVDNPTTLSGSIGVFGIIPNLGNFYKNQLGIVIDTVNSNKYADMGINRKLSNLEKTRMQNSVKNTYNTFITHVSNGRNMSKQEIDKIGQGRVWSGYNAKNIGLIDTYGGIEKAIKIASSLAEIEDYRILSLPTKNDPFTDFALKFGQNSKISKLVPNNSIINTKFLKQIEDIIKEKNEIQARIPYIIELK